MTLLISVILKIFNEEGVQNCGKNLGDDLMLWYIDGHNIFGSPVIAVVTGTTAGDDTFFSSCAGSV